MPLQKRLTAIALVFVLAFAASFVGIFHHRARHVIVADPASISQTLPDPSGTAEVPAPVVAPQTQAVVEAVFRPSSQPVLTRADVSDFARTLLKSVVAREDRSNADSDMFDVTVETSVVATDLKETDSPAHPIVGQIVLRTKRIDSPKDRHLRVLFIVQRAVTVRVVRDGGRWACIQAQERVESVYTLPDKANIGVKVGDTRDLTYRYEDIVAKAQD